MAENNPINGNLPVSIQNTSVALIGCGYWGRNYARVLIEENQVDRVIACDMSIRLLDEIASRHSTIECMTDISKVLADKKITACIVATPPETHFDIVKQILKSGKHVLVEKPFTTLSSDSRVLIDLAKKSRKVLMVGHTFLFNESVSKLREIVCDSDRFGSLYYLHATRTNLGPVRKDVNVMWDLAAHDISVFIYLLNMMPESVSAVGHSVLGTASKQCDVAFITLKFPGNKMAHIHVSWCEPNKVRRIVAVGSKCRVEFNDMNRTESIRVYNSSVSINREEDIELHTYADQVCFTDGDVHIPHIKLKEPLKSQVQTFLSAVSKSNKGEGEGVLSGGKLGLEVVQVLEAADRSLNSDGSFVTIEPVVECKQ